MVDNPDGGEVSGISLRSGRVIGVDGLPSNDGGDVSVTEGGPEPNLERRLAVLGEDLRRTIMGEVHGALRGFCDDLRAEIRTELRAEAPTPQPFDLPDDLGNDCRARAVSQGFFKPMKYDGSSPWDDYRTHFETVSRANGWDRAMMGSALASSLTGAALPILTELAGSQDYTQLVAALGSQFGDSNRAQLYMDRLRVRTQLPGEDISVFAREVRILARKALPGASRECVELLAVSQFVERLSDERIRELVMLGAPRDLEAALSLALRSEAAVIRARHATTGSIHAIQSPTEEAGAIQAARARTNMQASQSRGGVNQRLVCWRCDAVGHAFRDCPTKVVICWRCDAVGHNVRECPTRPGNERRS